MLANSVRKGAITGVLAAVAVILVLPCNAQESPSLARINEVVSNLSEVAKADLAKSLATQQALALKNVIAVQQSLDGIRTNPNPAPVAKGAAIAVKEDQLVTARREFVAVQAAKQAVLGTPSSVPATDLPAISDSILESIQVLSNPMLPTCGATLPYRGAAAQSGWQLTLDSFMRTYGAGLGAVGRLEVDEDQYVPGPDNTPIKKKFRRIIGTAFAVGDGRKILTAGHVAYLVWDFQTDSLRQNISAIYFNTGGEYSFKCDSPDKNARVVRLSTVSLKKFAPQTAPKDSPLDYAILAIAAEEASLDQTLRLAANSPIPPASFIVVIEYPSKDGYVPANLWAAAMSVPGPEGMFPVASIKRISPGMVRPRCTNASILHVSHDATTLNQSSGAPIIDINSGEVVAIQIAGSREFSPDSNSCNIGLRSDPTLTDLFK